MSLEQTRQRAKAVGTIHDIVGAMRAIAAGRIAGAQHALASARRYREVVLRGLAALRAAGDDLSALARPADLTTLVVLTSEAPLCGPFNQNVVALAEGRWRELRQTGRVFLIAVGHRGQRLLAARGVKADLETEAATSLAGVRDRVKELAVQVDARFAAGTLGTFRMIYSRYRSVSEQEPVEEQVWPLGPDSRIEADATLAARHQRYLPLPVVFAGLVSEYAYISLYRAAAESFASEQASRLVAMDGATHNTERMLQGLTDLERRERQDEITRQVLDLIGARFAAE